MTQNKTRKIQQLSFSINNWNHLYSLQQAVQHNQQYTGRKLGITGQIRNHPFLQNTDTTVKIQFLQSNDIPDYPLDDSVEHLPPTAVLGSMCFNDRQLSTEIMVDQQVFEELRKNLMEYADIDGIHIMLSIGVASDTEHWPVDQQLNILQLDYAMKGDA